MAHAPSLAQWRADWRGTVRAIDRQSLFTPRGRLTRGVLFARRDDRRYVSVHRDDLALVLDIAAFSLLNPPTGTGEATSRWRDLLWTYSTDPTAQPDSGPDA